MDPVDVRDLTACPLCARTSWTTRENAPPYRVVECGCGLIFVTPQPCTSLLRGAYGDEYYRAWRHETAARTRLWRQRLARIEAITRRRGRLLDVGCGDGMFLGVASRSGWQVTGTELSSAGVEAARAAGHRVEEGELWEADFPTGAFDVVTCWHVLEHVRDPRRLLVEIARILRPDGWLALATPNADDRCFRAAYRVARGRSERRFDPADRELHLFHFTARTLSALIAAAGLTPMAVGFDRGAATEPRKRLINGAAYLWYRVSGLNWGLGLELIARKLDARRREDVR